MEKEHHKEIRVILTALLLNSLVVAAVICTGELRGSPLPVWYVSISVFLFLLTAGFEAYSLKSSISKGNNETLRFEKLLKDQEQSGRLLIRRDLELTKANEQLRELDERKSEFLSVVAHQLRTPLSGIKWTLNMLLAGDLGPLNEEQHSFLLKGYESNQRMITLVEDMLNADRVGSGKYHYDFVSASLMDIFDNILYELIPLANLKGIKMSFSEHNTAIPNVSIDPEKVRGVLQNLLENAIKYSPNKGTVKIKLRQDGNFVEVGIVDNGIGIPKDQQKHIFNRFYRAPNAIKLQTDGSGLGLFIVKGIVERHGGKVWFESEENKGSTFYFTLKVG